MSMSAGGTDQHFLKSRLLLIGARQWPTRTIKPANVEEAVTELTTKEQFGEDVLRATLKFPPQLIMGGLQQTKTVTCSSLQTGSMSPLVHKQYLRCCLAHARGTVSHHHVSVLPTTCPALIYAMQDSAKTRRLTWMTQMRNNAIPLRIQMNLISVVAFTDSICVKMSLILALA